MKHLAFLVLSLFSIQANANSSAFSSSVTQPSTSQQSSANVSQQTGGNYIFVENGKLTFNLEPSLFENRKWQYNQQTDAAIVGFETNLPLRTKNSSDFHVYELTMGYKVYELTENGEMKFVKATTEKPPRAGLIHPVYTPRTDKGQTYHVWLPAAVWTVRIVGAVARQVVPPIITRAAATCAANATMCAIGVGITSGHAVALCAVNYFFDGAVRKFLKLPKTVCEKAEKAGWKKKGGTGSSSDDYEYVKEYKITIKGHYGNYRLHHECPECSSGYREFKIGADSEAEAVEKLRQKCLSHIGGSYKNEDESSTWYGLSGTVVEAELTKTISGYACSGYAEDEEGRFPFGGFSASLSHDTMIETMQVFDIADLVSKDFQSDPTPYINDSGQVGKELRESIQSSAAIQKKDGTQGTLMASSEPYLDPDSGAVKQDIVAVQSNTSPDLLPFSNGSGSGSVGSGGGSVSSSGGVSGGNTNGGTTSGLAMPQGTNNVSVNTIDRPDQAANAKPAANNSPNGTGIGSSLGNGLNSGMGTGDSQTGGSQGSGSQNTGSQSGTPNGEEKGEEKGGLDCSGKHKNTLACSGLGSASEGDFDGIKIPTTTDNTTYEPDMFLPSTGTCPAPKVFHVWGKPFEISYEPLCRFMEMVRFIILTAFILMSAYLTFGSLRRD